MRASQHLFSPPRDHNQWQPESPREPPASSLPTVPNKTSKMETKSKTKPKIRASGHLFSSIFPSIPQQQKQKAYSPSHQRQTAMSSPPPPPPPSLSPGQSKKQTPTSRQTRSSRHVTSGTSGQGSSMDPNHLSVTMPLGLQASSHNPHRPNRPSPAGPGPAAITDGGDSFGAVVGGATPSYRSRHVSEPSYTTADASHEPIYSHSSTMYSASTGAQIYDHDPPPPLGDDEFSWMQKEFQTLGLNRR